MSRVDVVVECDVAKSFRVSQVAGMFDVSLEDKLRESFSVDIPNQDEDWQIGVIVGPSGSGKSTVSRQAFGDSIFSGFDWGSGSLLDAFPPTMSSQDITALLTSVGFSSPPSWAKPYRVLSNGEKFRCDLAMSLAIGGDMIAFDEFTSVVDRTVAKIGSAAVSKSIRNGRIKKKFVAITCHYDIVEWLEPDWVLDMATRTLSRGRLRRPEIQMEVRRVGHKVWDIFRKHHYLSGSFLNSAVAFCGFIEGVPAAMASFRMFPHPKKSFYMAHRTVVLPDFQGVGIGARLSDMAASALACRGLDVRYTLSHPALIAAMNRSPRWRLMAKQTAETSSRAKGCLKGAKTAAGRITYRFKYIGEKNLELARSFQLI